MGRPPLTDIYMRFARDLARRSTCARSQVGSVITTEDMTQVLAIGYNGNARKLANQCDSDEPGRCGCVHSESNAIAKCGHYGMAKTLFVTLSPCVLCAKLVVNSGITKVYFMTLYRNPDGVIILRQCLGPEQVVQLAVE